MRAKSHLPIEKDPDHSGGLMKFLYADRHSDKFKKNQFTELQQMDHFRRRQAEEKSVKEKLEKEDLSVQKKLWDDQVKHIINYFYYFPSNKTKL